MKFQTNSIIMKLKSKLFAGAVSVAMVLGLAVPASAQTTAELTAQINSLLAMIAQLQAQLNAQGGSTGGAMTGGAGVVFTKDQTIGSTGSEVTALQQWLVSKGYLVMPAGVAYGYFGNLTKSALAKYQAENGISPAVGYFGPITRSSINAMASVPTTPTVPTYPTTPTTGGTGITTPGVEGTLSVTQNNSGIASTLYEGDSMASILGFDVKAQNSDIAVQRVKLNLGTNTAIYNKIYRKLYVTDGSNVLASVDLNSSTVVKDSGTYYITIAGFNYVVPKDQKKTIVIKADAYGTFDSSDVTTFNSNTVGTVSLDTNGVRGVDGAGIDQYAGSTSISKDLTLSANLADSATLTVSLNSSTPKKADIVCTSGANEDECDKLTVLVFDVKAEKDSVKITDMNIAIDKASSVAASSATASTTLYLFDGSTEIDNANVGSLNTAVFDDIDYVVPKDTTKTLTVKVDIRNASTNRATFTASASSTGFTAENSIGDSVTKSGSATGYAMGVLNVGPEFTLVSKSITTSGVPQNNGVTTNVSTSTLTATFNLKIKAVGGAIEFGTSQATTSPLVSSTTGFGIYRNGAVDATIGSNATSTSISFPTTCTTAGFTNSCSLPEGSEVTVPISFQIQGRIGAGTVLTSGLYSVDIARLNWIDPTNGKSSNTTFMSGETDWRTSDVSFP